MKGQNNNTGNFIKGNTSAHDSRQNMGAVGAQPSRMRPNLGTQQVDKHDQVKMEDRKAYDAKYSSGKSDAKKSAGLPEGTADHK